MDNSDKAVLQLGKGILGVVIMAFSLMLIPKLMSNQKVSVTLTIVGLILGGFLLYSAIQKSPKTNHVPGP